MRQGQRQPPGGATHAAKRPGRRHSAARPSSKQAITPYPRCLRTGLPAGTVFSVAGVPVARDVTTTSAKAGTATQAKEDGVRCFAS